MKERECVLVCGCKCLCVKMCVCEGREREGGSGCVSERVSVRDCASASGIESICMFKRDRKKKVEEKKTGGETYLSPTH